MKRSVRLTALIAAAGMASLAVGETASASGTPAPTAPTLAEVLLSDSAGDDSAGFDHNWHDYDIVTQAVLLFPDLVEAASDPTASLTAFLPNDAAFRRLVKELTGSRPRTEAATFDGVAALTLDTVKTVLTYHLVPAKISAATALASNGASLPTLQGSEIGVKIRHKALIKLVDLDPDARNPWVVQPEIGGEASNGFAHGIDRVLRPLDL